LILRLLLWFVGPPDHRFANRCIRVIRVFRVIRGNQFLTATADCADAPASASISAVDFINCTNLKRRAVSVYIRVIREIRGKQFPTDYRGRRGTRGRRGCSPERID
jgi:hypothetical protein